MKWTNQQLREYEQRQAAAKARRASSRAQPEPALCHEPVAAEAREAGDAIRVHVRVVSLRRRLCDPDNLCPKYFVDCLRYAGLIRNDRPEDIALEVRQVRVKSRDQERTEIEIV